MTTRRQSKRSTSKRVLLANTILLWVAVGYALWTEQTSASIAFVGTILSLATAYMGIGHLDYKTAAKVAIETQTPQEDMSAVSAQILEAGSDADGPVSSVPNGS